MVFMREGNIFSLFYLKGEIMKPTKKINRNKKVFSILSIVAIIATFFILETGSIYAEGVPNEATNIMKGFMDIIFTFVRFFGIFLAAWGVFDIGSSMSSHDSNQRSTGIKLLVGGIIVIFAKEILNAIGVTW